MFKDIIKKEKLWNDCIVYALYIPLQVTPINIVKDINGVEIKPGYLVLIHCDEEIRKAKVVEVFQDRPTTNYFGFWVDVDDGNGVEGVMSYIIEVIKEENNV